MKLNTLFLGCLFRWMPIRFSRIIKLVTLLMFLAIVQTSAASFSQTLSLKERNVGLEKLLQIIESKSGYVFFYDKRELPNVNITIDRKDITVDEAVAESLKDLGINFKIVSKTVVLTKEENAEVSKLRSARFFIDVKIKVVDEAGQPLPNATVKIKDSNTSFSTNAQGELSIQSLSSDAVLQISYLGYKVKEVPVAGAKGTLRVTLESVNRSLNEVQIVNTGYQKIPKERATGSFELIDSAVINRVTGSNFINRLEGVSPSLIFFNKDPNRPKAENRIRIRTESSILALNPPLIVVDNFPYSGDLDNINPNDIENITLLKDAAAASIWGIRASRGVIVITTKKGKLNQPLRIDFNTNVTTGQKPDLYAMRQASPADYIQLEQFFFDRGKYNVDLNPANDNSPNSVSPAVKIMYQLREEQIDSATAKSKLAALASHDVRDDFLKYAYRNLFYQQYALNINGGSEKATYSLSSGYDKNLNSLKSSDYDRVTLRSNASFRPIDKLEIQTGLSFALGTNNDNSAASSLDYNLFRNAFGKRPYMYLRLADDAGNPLVYDEYAQRKSWLNGLGTGITTGKLLNWDYNPLAEVNTTSIKSTSQDILFNVGAKYQIIPELSAELNYQYEKIDQNSKDIKGVGSFYTRNQINLFSSWPGGVLKQNLPYGDILDIIDNSSVSNIIRGRLNFNKTWGQQKHQIDAVAGVERSQLDYTQDGNRKYGYDQETLSFRPVNLDSAYSQLNGRYGPYNFERGAIAFYGGTLSRNVSLFTIATYTYLNKYSFSGSMRRDASNVLGVSSNRRWKPLWSAGFGWNISREDFYKWEAMPELKLRVTYGYNGNSNNVTSALALITYGGPSPVTGLPIADINSPPNPDLTFEKIGQMNVGIDFSSKNQVISGTIEGFLKYGKNLLANTLVDLTTGFSNLTTNSANTTGKGIELTLNSNNLGNSAFKWNSTLLFAYNRTIVTDFFGPAGDLQQIVGNLQQNPIKGRDANAVYALKFAGLDPENGDPMGYVNGEPSTDYNKLLSPKPFSVDSLKYFGTASPVYSGVLGNTFSYKGISLYVSIIGKFNYFFRKTGMSYSDFLQTGESNSDFSKRWQKPGDENITNIPSPSDNALRDRFYQYSEAMVLPGDHIRIQNIVLNYNVPLKLKYMRNLRLYANAMNVNVIIWRKNKEGIDPDYGNFIPSPRTLALGASVNF